ncbi:hypothetical protein Sa4125_11210 [Aureimonas sp. SA4125]|nr:hypothetical protein Sa4125_11210 [Aureimonas sp. SA4125]
MFGIGTALGQITHQVTAITADDSVVLSWPNALWPKFSGAYPGFVAETLRIFGNRADEMSDRVVELSTKPVEQRGLHAFGLDTGASRARDRLPSMRTDPFDS